MTRGNQRIRIEVVQVPANPIARPDLPYGVMQAPEPAKRRF